MPQIVRKFSVQDQSAFDYSINLDEDTYSSLDKERFSSWVSLLPTWSFRGVIMRRALAKLITSIVICAVVACGLPCHADDVSDHSDARLDHLHGFVFFIDADTPKDHFKYHGSKVFPIVRLKVFQRAIAWSKKRDEDVKTEKYEELWYYDGKPIGSRQYSQFKIEPKSIGTIIVRTMDGDPRQSQAMASAIVKLSVDLRLRDTMLSSIVLPRDKYKETVEYLGNYGFYGNFVPTSGIQMSLHMRSNPPGLDEYLYYRKRLDN